MCPGTDEPKCGSIQLAVTIIGDKWSSLILSALFNGTRRFTELEQNLGIGPRTLSQRLHVLEEKGIISKQRFAEVPPRIEYSLTSKGDDLLPVLLSMADWAAKYQAN
ncbi:MAG TPA: helix-turn-helix domain-containing protein [Patescibacteria group bacterium]|nr:helix-turn-helix domain-containing protein [Patescibacteria group bacterium]